MVLTGPSIQMLSWNCTNVHMLRGWKEKVQQVF